MPCNPIAFGGYPLQSQFSFPQQYGVPYGEQSRMLRSQIAQYISHLIIMQRISHRYFSDIAAIAPCAYSRGQLMQLANWSYNGSNELLRLYSRYVGRSFVPRLPYLSITSYKAALRQAQIHLQEMYSRYGQFQSAQLPTYMHSIFGAHYGRLLTWMQMLEQLLNR